MITSDRRAHLFTLAAAAFGIVACRDTTTRPSTTAPGVVEISPAPASSAPVKDVQNTNAVNVPANLTGTVNPVVEPVNVNPAPVLDVNGHKKGMKGKKGNHESTCGEGSCS